MFVILTSVDVTFSVR